MLESCLGLTVGDAVPSILIVGKFPSRFGPGEHQSRRRKTSRSMPHWTKHRNLTTEDCPKTLLGRNHHLPDRRTKKPDKVEDGVAGQVVSQG